MPPQPKPSQCDSCQAMLRGIQRAQILLKQASALIEGGHAGRGNAMVDHVRDDLLTLMKFAKLDPSEERNDQGDCRGKHEQPRKGR